LRIGLDTAPFTSDSAGRSGNLIAVPTVGKRIALPSGDSMELLETAHTTAGACVRARIVFATTGSRVPAHLHPRQVETYEVISGSLTYLLNGAKHTAPAGTIVHLPQGVAHQHYCEGPEDAVTVQTMTPGLDFDYILETIFGLGAEGRLRGVNVIVQGLVLIQRMKAAFVFAAYPVWLQKTLARIVTPVAYRLGYRAVYRRFSGEEW
jgi:quercetin dioxygenase-like cupin family protein